MSTIKKLINLYQNNKEIVRDESEQLFLEHIKELKVHTDLFYKTKQTIKYLNENIEFIHKKNKVKYVATHISSIHWFEDNEKVYQAKVSLDRLDRLIELQKKLSEEIIRDIENLRIDAKMQLKFKQNDNDFTLLIEQNKLKLLMNNWRQWQWQKKHSKSKLKPESIWTYGKLQYKKLCLECMTKLGRMYDLKSYARLNYAEYYNDVF